MNKRILKKSLAFIMAGALALSSVPVSAANGKVKLSSRKVTVVQGKTKKIKVRVTGGYKLKKVKVTKIGNRNIARVTARKNKVTIRGLQAGTTKATLGVTYKAKKKIKTKKLSFRIKVKDAVGNEDIPTPEASVETGMPQVTGAAPTTSPTVGMTSSPSPGIPLPSPQQPQSSAVGMTPSPSPAIPLPSPQQPQSSAAPTPGFETPQPTGGETVTYREGVLKEELQAQTDYEILDIESSDPDEITIMIPQNKDTNQIWEDDIIVLPENSQGEGVVLKVDSIDTDDDGNYRIVGETPKLSEVCSEIYLNDTVQADMSDFVYNPDVLQKASTASARTYTSKGYIAKGVVGERVTVGEAQTFTLKDRAVGEYGKLSGSVTIRAPEIEALVDIKAPFINEVNLSVKETIVGTAKLEFSTDSGNKKNEFDLYLGHVSVPIPQCPGCSVYIIFYLEFNAEGQATVKCSLTNTFNIHYDKEDGLTPDHDINISFDGTEAEVSGELLFDAQPEIYLLGRWNEAKKAVVGGLDIIGADIKAGPGLKSSAKAYDSAPYVCTNMDIYAALSASLDTDGGVGESVKELFPSMKTAWTILQNDARNPFRLNWHYEDGVKINSGICSHASDAPSTSNRPSVSAQPSTSSRPGVTTAPVNPPVEDDNWDTDPSTSDDFTYTVSSNQATITGYTGSSVNVVIPTSIDGYKVVAIRGSAFKDNTSIMSVTIPGTVTAIGYEGTTSSTWDGYNGAFQGCTRLSSVTVRGGSGSAYIGNRTFQDCISLEKIVIPGNYEVIYGNAFRSCTALESMSWAKTTEVKENQRIEEYTFYGDTALTTVELNSVKEIGMAAFCGDTSLTSVTLNEGLKTIKGSAFKDCMNLLEITIPGTVTAIGYEETTSSTWDGYNGAFQGDERLETVILASGGDTAYIGNKTFQGCISLKKIVIPGNYEVIYGNAFRSCTALESMSWAKTTEVKENQRIEEYAFYGDTALATVELNSVKEIGLAAFYGDTSLTSVTLNEGLKTIKGSAFKDCMNLSEITIPGTVTAIGYEETTSSTWDGYNGVFQGDIRLKTVYFRGCQTDSGAYIGNRTFSGCSALNAVYFYKEAPSFISNCFNNVTATVYYPSGKSSWTSDVMQNYGGTITWSSKS